MLIANDCDDRECGDCPHWNQSGLDCDLIDRAGFEHDMSRIRDAHTRDMAELFG